MPSSSKHTLKLWLNGDLGEYLSKMVNLVFDFMSTENAPDLTSENNNEIYMLNAGYQTFMRERIQLSTQDITTQQAKHINRVINIIDKLPLSFCDFCVLYWDNKSINNETSNIAIQNINLSEYKIRFPTFEELRALSNSKEFWKVKQSDYYHIMVGLSNYLSNIQTYEISENYITEINRLLPNMIKGMLNNEKTDEKIQSIAINVFGYTSFLVKQIMQGEEKDTSFYVALLNLEKELNGIKSL